jgi:hypothetical protein
MVGKEELPGSGNRWVGTHGGRQSTIRAIARKARRPASAPRAP